MSNFAGLMDRPLPHVPPPAVSHIPAKIRTVDLSSDSMRSSSHTPSNMSVSVINESGAREVLQSYGWPPGLQDTFLRNLQIFPIRFFVCDDSGSMVADDGHKLVEKNGSLRLTSCSRWTELGEALKFHVAIARAANAPTEFRLLNGSQPLIIGTSDSASDENYGKFMASISDTPGGGTPLCKHIREIIAKIRTLEPKLRQRRQRACVIIATDGESSDGDIVQAMKPLTDLPVWVVVRLCTDEEQVVEYWNKVDKDLELEMDVLDDFCGEAEEVYDVNSWLNYGEPLQRMREFGIPLKEIDMLDESLLSLERLRMFCSILFGGKLDDYPHPEMDWEGFLAKVRRENERLPKMWSPIDRVPKEWVDVQKLVSCYKRGNCSIM